MYVRNILHRLELCDLKTIINKNYHRLKKTQRRPNQPDF